MRHGTFHHSKLSRTVCPVRPGIAGGLVFIVLLACTVGAFGAMIQVTPCGVGADNNGKYDRNPSPVMFNGQMWVFYTKADDGSTGGVRNPSYNPDNDSYVIWYVQPQAVGDSVVWAETRLDLSETNRPEGFDQRDVSAVVFNEALYVFASAGFGGSQQPIYYYKWDGSWTGPTPLYTGGGGHANAVCDADRVYITLETGVEATLKSVVYTWDGATFIGPFEIAAGNGVPKITLWNGTLYAVSIAPGAATINLHTCPASASPASWTYVSDPITVADAYVWDPSIYADVLGLHVLAAPSTAVPDRQWIVQTSSADDGLTWTPVHTVSSGGNGEIYWWDYWPVAWSDGSGDAMIFFTTEAKEGVYGDGMIGGIGIDWDMTHDHTFYIQPAIDMASNGDTVEPFTTFVGDGNRDLDFRGKSILVRAKPDPDPQDVTTIDCQGSITDPHYAFFLHGGEDTNAVIEGFILTNAYNDFAAVRCSTASPTIRNCQITQNECPGIYASNGSNPHVEECTIANNAGHGAWAENTSGVFYSPEPSTLYVDSCVIADNSAGGIRIEAADAVVSRSVIAGNQGDGVAAWWTVHLDMSSSLLRNNGGKGLFIVLSSGQFSVSNCTIVGNETGIYYDGSPPLDRSSGGQGDTSRISSSIVAFNDAQGINLGAFAWWMPHRIECSDAFGNPGGNWTGGASGLGDTLGNFSLNPIFCDTAAGDFHISSTSSCAPAYNSCAMLIGRYGISCVKPYICGDANEDGAVNLADAIFIINYAFRSGPSPDPVPAGDPNCDNAINVGDVVHIVNYVFKGGPEPCCP